MIVVAYDVAYSDVRVDLVHFVNAMIKQGWQPVGPIQVVSEHDCGPYPDAGYYQTMTKRGPDHTADVIKLAKR